MMYQASELGDDLIEQFNADYAPITLTRIESDYTQYSAMLAAGNPPDIMRTQAPDIPQFLARGIMMDLTDYFAASPVLKEDDLLDVNNAMLAVTYATLTVISSSMAGFAFARIPAPGRNQLFAIVIALLMVPTIVLIIPQFMLFSRLRLTNSYWPWVLWGITGNSFHIFLFRQFFAGFPRELEDAAEVDGASTFRFFWQVLLPNAKPVLAASFIFAFMFVWSDWFQPMIYLSPQKTTMAVKLLTGYNNPQGFPYITFQLAAAVLFTLPRVEELTQHVQGSSLYEWFHFLPPP